ncbi:hypothetical protein [Vibrio spartinae]|uniref:Uncharacterized protein n=1 Tax=Vibrio spartinae TaxID=1918945 RepID=A0A1N6M6F2_9VIBR|nr:hypothetical protein [Vibrio spartinae]SIO95021.1 hypothetical protein VSP9026_02760 [Vibrio spartinae]
MEHTNITIEYPNILYFDGLWKHTGYGDIYQLNDTESKIYQFNSEGCVLAETMTKVAMQATYFPNATLSDDGMNLTSHQIARPFVQQFERLSALPAMCQPGQLFRYADISP